MAYRFPPPSMRFPPPHLNAFQPHIPGMAPQFFSSAPPPYRPIRPVLPESESDKAWINTFLHEIGKDRDVVSRLPRAKIRESVEAIDTCAAALQELEKMEQDMAANIDTITAHEWEVKCEAAKMQQVVLSEQLSKLPDDNGLPALKVALARRKQRRERGRQRRKILAAEAKAQRSARQRSVALAEARQRKEADRAEAARGAAQVAAEAALVLADTSRRQQDARSHLSTLSALLRLRTLRATAGAGCGEPAQASTAFGAAVHALADAWTSRQRQYDIEEVGLRLMLNHGSEDSEQKRPAAAQWRRVLFGVPQREDRQYLAAEDSLDAFVNVRRDWDQFVVDRTAPMSSCIPIGWVLPAPPSSPSWAELLVGKK